MFSSFPAQVKPPLLSFLNEQDLICTASTAIENYDIVLQPTLWQGLLKQDFFWQAPSDVEDYKSYYQSLLNERIKLISFVLLYTLITYDGDGYNIGHICLESVDDPQLYVKAYNSIRQDPLTANDFVITMLKLDQTKLSNHINKLGLSYFNLLTHFLSDDKTNVEQTMKNIRQFRSLTIDDSLSLFFNVICTIGAKKLLTLFLDKHPSLLSPEKIWMSLQHAVAHLQPVIVRHLIAIGTDLNNIIVRYNFDGENMFHEPSLLSAAILKMLETGKIMEGKEIIQCLLDNGANPDLAEKNIISARSICLSRVEEVSDEAKEILNSVINAPAADLNIEPPQNATPRPRG